jgi:hypothetical protein
MIRQWLGNCECFNLAKKLPEDKKIPLGCYTLYKYILLFPNLKTQFSRNKPKTLVFNDCKRAFWACFRENWVYKFRHVLYLFTQGRGEGWGGGGVNQ